ncbi:MAG: ABC transporter permease [Clostridia bacterium]|nr:ABC transporter permease [Clostridia bacterium]
MEALKAGILSEITKLLLKKKSVMLLVFSALIPILSLILVSFFQSGLGINPINAIDFPITVLGYFTGLFLPLFVVMAAADLFSGEIGERTIKIALLRPITRFKVYMSKIISIAIYISVYLGIVYIVSTVLGLFLEGRENILQAILKNFAAYIVAIVPMLLLGIAAAFISQFFKSSSGTLVISVLLFIIIKIAAVAVPDISGLTPISNMDWHLLWLSGSVSISKLFSVFMFMFSYSIIFLASGYLMFERKEF